MGIFDLFRRKPAATEAAEPTPAAEPPAFRQASGERAVRLTERNKRLKTAMAELEAAGEANTETYIGMRREYVQNALQLGDYSVIGL